MMQGLPPRGEVRRKHGTNVRVDGQKPNRRRPYRTSGQLTAKSIIHQGAKRRFGDCARKVTELTPGDLSRVASATEVAVAKSKEWLSQHRHWKRRDQQKQLVMMLRGFYQYFGLHHCKPKLDGVRREVQRQWARTLRRRSQRHRLYWSYLLRQSWFELPYAVSTLHATV